MAGFFSQFLLDTTAQVVQQKAINEISFSHKEPYVTGHQTVGVRY